MRIINRDIIGKIEEFQNIKVVSFDIFDTLIFRHASEPKEVFERVYDKVSQFTPNIENAKEFRDVRAKAEADARVKMQETNDTREVNLEEIYNCFPEGIHQLEYIMECEYEEELKCCYLNADIAEAIDYLKDYYRIILTSDMYLGEKRIRNILIKSGFDVSVVEKVYISCDYRRNKGTGTLYSYVMNDLDVSSNEIFHIGDNKISDYMVPQNRGIYAFLYTK